MLNRNVTWGQLRTMKQQADSSGEILSENPLNDVEFAEATKDMPDSEYYFDVSEEELAQFAEQNQAAKEKFWVTSDDDGNVLGLIRDDVEEGKYYIRKDGDWTPVEPQDDVPELDDLPMHQVFNKDLVAYWDSKQGLGLTLATVSPYL